MKKQPQVTEQTKKNLQEAFWSLYTKKDIAKISVKEITDCAGYNRGTFYLYYKDVYDLLEQMESEILEKIDDMIQEALPKLNTCNLNNLIQPVLEMTNPYSKYVKVLLGENGDAGFSIRFKHILRPLFANVLNFDRLPYDDYQKSLLLEFWLSGTIGIVMKWFNDPQISIEQFITLVAPVILGMNQE